MVVLATRRAVPRNRSQSGIVGVPGAGTGGSFATSSRFASVSPLSTSWYVFPLMTTVRTGAAGGSWPATGGCWPASGGSEPASGGMARGMAGGTGWYGPYGAYGGHGAG